jgi:hypothetical protein
MKQNGVQLVELVLTIILIRKIFKSQKWGRSKTMKQNVAQLVELVLIIILYRKIFKIILIFLEIISILLRKF